MSTMVNQGLLSLFQSQFMAQWFMGVVSIQFLLICHLRPEWTTEDIFMALSITTLFNPLARFSIWVSLPSIFLNIAHYITICMFHFISHIICFIIHLPLFWRLGLSFLTFPSFTYLCIWDNRKEKVLILSYLLNNFLSVCKSWSVDWKHEYVMLTRPINWGFFFGFLYIYINMYTTYILIIVSLTINLIAIIIQKQWNWSIPVVIHSG